MNARQIEIFHAVMAAGTVTEAAKRLGITQPSATASLRQIEDALGFNLFHRVGGRLSPTSEARQLFQEAERLQDSLTVFKNLAARLKKDLTTHLRVTAPPALCHELLPSAVAAFSADNPSCLLDITTQHHGQILDDIAATGGESNLGFTFGTDNREGNGSIPIGKAPIVALVPKSWPLAQQETVSIEELAAKPRIATFAGEPLGNAVQALLDTVSSRPIPPLRAHSHSLAASLVSRGLGSTIIDGMTASYLLAHLKETGFKACPVQDTAMLTITAIFSYEHPLSKHATALIDAFRKAYRTLEKRTAF